MIVLEEACRQMGGEYEYDEIPGVLWEATCRIEAENPEEKLGELIGDFYHAYASAARAGYQGDFGLIVEAPGAQPPARAELWLSLEDGADYTLQTLIPLDACPGLDPLTVVKVRVREGPRRARASARVVGSGEACAAHVTVHASTRVVSGPPSLGVLVRFARAAGEAAVHVLRRAGGA